MKFFFSITNRAFTLAVLLMISSSALVAQSTFSTYSRYGIGLPSQPGSMTHFGMGGVTTPITDGTLINFANPASYSFNGITTLQVNGIGSMLSATTKESSMQYRAGQVNEFGLLFKKPGSRWAYAAGLSPYSSIGYNLSTREAVNDSTFARKIYSGEGGLNKMTLGTSRNFTIYQSQIRLDSLNKKDTTIKIPMHQLSVGVNVNYLFGNLVRTNNVEFDNATIYNTRETAKLQNRGFVFEFGALYKVRIAKREENSRIVGESHLYFGLNYSMQSRIRSVLAEKNTRYVVSNGAQVDVSDTFVSDETKGKMTIPQRFAFGVAYRKSAKKWGRYTVAADYKIQDWSRYTVSFESPFEQQGSLDKASTLSLGFEYEPSVARTNDFLHRVSYRVGVRQTDTHLYIQNTPIKQQAASVGISIPVIRSLSRFHAGVEYMTGGTLDNNLIFEKGFNFMVGLTLTPAERWFYQRKYD